MLTGHFSTASRRPKLKALIKMIDRLLQSLNEKPQKQTTANFSPVNDKDIETTDLSLDVDESSDASNDVSNQKNDKQPISRNTDETFPTSFFTPMTPPVRYEKLVGSMNNRQMNVYALPFLFNKDEVSGPPYKPFATPLPSKSSNKIQSFYVKTAQNSNLPLETPIKSDRMSLTAFSPGETVVGSTANSQEHGLNRDKDLKKLLLEWLRDKSNDNKHNREWRDDKERETLASYYDTTDNDLLSLSIADLNRFSDYLKLRLGQSQDSDTSQDVFNTHLPLHVHENPQHITQKVNSLLGVSSTASAQQKSVCWDGNIFHNYTLVGGINAGTFTDNGKTSNMDICMQFCCKRDSCDLAFMIEDDCYSVACNSNGACEPRKARPTHYLPRIAIRKKPQGENI